MSAAVFVVLLPGRFCQAQIDASPELTVERVSNRDGK